MTHSFAARVIHDLGALLFPDTWTSEEPGVILNAPIRHRHDTATPPADVQRAARLLYHCHHGYRARADRDIASGLGLPIPSPDEWTIAHGVSQQLWDAAVTAFNRYRTVIDTLVSLFELGIVVAASRPNLAGDFRPIAPGDWLNECYPSWFATCQLDPIMPYIRVPVREGGGWLYVDKRSYLAWRNLSFGPQLGRTREQPAQVPNEAPASDEGPREAGEHEASTGCGNDDAHQPTEQPPPPAAEHGETPEGVDATNAAETVIGEPALGIPPPSSTAAAPELVPLQIQSAPAGPSASLRGSADSGDMLKHAPSPKRGSKPRYDWPAFDVEALRRATSEPRPRSARALTAEMLQWCLDCWGKEPSESRARTRVAKVLASNGLTLD